MSDLLIVVCVLAGILGLNVAMEILFVRRSRRGGRDAIFRQLSDLEVHRRHEMQSPNPVATSPVIVRPSRKIIV